MEPESNCKLTRCQKLLLQKILSPKEPVKLLKERLILGIEGPAATLAASSVALHIYKEEECIEEDIIEVPKDLICSTKKTDEMFADGEENIKDFQDALVDKDLKLLCPDVTVIEDVRYNKLYRPLDSAQLSNLRAEEYIQNMPCPDSDTDSEYDMDSDDEIWLKEKKTEGLNITLILFEDIISNFNQLQVDKLDDAAFQRAIKKYPLSAPSDLELKAILGYWTNKGKEKEQKNEPAWAPKIKTGDKALNAPEGYKVFRTGVDKSEPRVLRSQKETCSFKKASDVMDKSTTMKKKLEEMSHRLKTYVSDSSKIRSGICAHLDKATKYIKEGIMDFSFNEPQMPLLRPCNTHVDKEINQPNQIPVLVPYETLIISSDDSDENSVVTKRRAATFSMRRSKRLRKKEVKTPSPKLRGGQSPSLVSPILLPTPTIMLDLTNHPPSYSSPPPLKCSPMISSTGLENNSLSPVNCAEIGSVLRASSTSPLAIKTENQMNECGHFSLLSSQNQKVSQS